MEKVIINNVQYRGDFLKDVFFNSSILMDLAIIYLADPNCPAALWIEQEHLPDSKKAAFIYYITSYRVMTGYSPLISSTFKGFFSRPLVD